MNTDNLTYLPYTATSISIIGRFIFMFLLYKNKSTNSLSLLFCILSISSSGMWLYYSVKHTDIPMVTRCSAEILLLTISAAYIIQNKIQTREHILPI
jgi:lipid-A-disaccharide synthase-like uncharacterized protein